LPRNGPSAAALLDRAEARSWSDRYLLFLLAVLAGYAFLGKGFAYLGAPPLFIGEIALLLGAVAFLRTGLLFACLTTFPSLILASLMAWTLLRTLPFVSLYGFDALRDSTIVMYGAFAYIVMALLLDDGRRLDAVMQYYIVFLRFFVPTIPVLFAVSQYAADFIPKVPGTDVTILHIGAGEAPVHLAGAATCALVGFYRPTATWIISLLATVVMASTINRGGMLAFVIPVFFAAVVSGKARFLAKVLVIGVVIFGAAYAVESVVYNGQDSSTQRERQLRPSQLVENAKSILGAKDPKLEASRIWRLQWWTLIMQDTLYGGPHFWTGRGFGLNLAVEDGYGGERDASPLRSPHNAHMTLLARAGVPGLAIWILFLLSWLATMAAAFIDARRRRESNWSGLFLLIGCYAMACIINATFDVALEGPMQGVWFWCLIGFGIGSVMIFHYTHRSPVAERSDP
jgi:hypothetical protein